jgi:hypothetical protein
MPVFGDKKAFPQGRHKGMGILENDIKLSAKSVGSCLKM